MQVLSYNWTDLTQTVQVFIRKMQVLSFVSNFSSKHYREMQGFFSIKSRLKSLLSVCPWEEEPQAARWALYVLTIILFHNFRQCQRTTNMTTRNDGASESSYAVIFPLRICPLLQMRRRRTMTDMEDNVLPPSVAMRMPLLRHSLLVLLLWHLFLICVTTAFLSLCCVSCSGTPFVMMMRAGENGKKHLDFTYEPRDCEFSDCFVFSSLT